MKQFKGVALRKIRKIEKYKNIFVSSSIMFFSRAKWIFSFFPIPLSTAIKSQTRNFNSYVFTAAVRKQSLFDFKNRKAHIGFAHKMQNSENFNKTYLSSSIVRLTGVFWGSFKKVINLFNQPTKTHPAMAVADQRASSLSKQNWS